MTEWTFRGRELNNCNCAYGCPCQFNALPTTGHCEAINVVHIDEGRYGDVPLDGLRFVTLYSWPGAIHEGNGTMQVIIDERADERQRAALLAITKGEDTDEVATIWWVASKMCPTKLEPLFEKIDFQIDIDGRTGRAQVPGLVESSVEPIRNPVTGAPHRARVNLPHGFEYDVAEYASGSTRTSAGIRLELSSSHSHLASLHIGTHGVVHPA